APAPTSSRELVTANRAYQGPARSGDCSSSRGRSSKEPSNRGRAPSSSSSRELVSRVQELAEPDQQPKAPEPASTPVRERKPEQGRRERALEPQEEPAPRSNPIDCLFHKTPETIKF